MRVNVVQMGNGSVIVVTIAEDEARGLIEIAKVLDSGTPILTEGSAIRTMQKLEALLESGIEEIEQVVEVEQASDN